MATKYMARALGQNVTSASATFMELYAENNVRTVYVRGVFDAASAAVQISPDPPSTADAASTWINVMGGVFTAPGYVDLNSTFEKMRAVVTGGDTGTAIDVIMMSPGT